MAKKAYAQVYSLIRHDRSSAVLSALNTFSELGYDGIEGIGPNSGGMTVADFKKYLDSLGLDMCSVMSLNNEEEWAFGAAVGARFAVANFGYASASREDILNACNECNALSKRMKESSGLMNLIHNHATEYEWVDGIEGGTRIYDFIIENTDPAYVGFEIDVGWTMFSGVKPESCLLKYPGRFPIIHVKECNRIAKDHEEREHFPKRVLALGEPKLINGARKFSPEQEQMMYEARNFNVELGHGLIDWKSLVSAADAQKIDVYWVSEREYYHCYDANGDETLCARYDCEFIHNLEGKRS
jgi:sugar phosphate isomerase/epimerase